MDSATAASVLGVPADASRADIERAFRRRARLEHPDLTGDPSAFAAVTEARDVLVRAQGWKAPPVAPEMVRHGVASVPRRGFELHPVALASLSGLLILGSVIAATASTSPFPLIDPLLRSVLLVIAVVGYALTHRRALAVASAIAIVATAVATIAWVSFGTLLGGAIMVPAIVLLILHGRGRPL